MKFYLSWFITNPNGIELKYLFSVLDGERVGKRERDENLGKGYFCTGMSSKDYMHASKTHAHIFACVFEAHITLTTVNCGQKVTHRYIQYNYKELSVKRGSGCDVCQSCGHITRDFDCGQ